MSRSSSLLVFALVACSGAFDGAIGGGEGGAPGGSSGASSPGGAPSTGSGGSIADSGAGQSMGGQASGGRGSGGPATGGQATAGQTTGGRSNGGQAGLGGASAGRGGAGGAGGRASVGGAGVGGAGTAGAATAGSGACVENIRCKLDPPPTTGDMAQDCVDRINQFRTQCACLPPLERWTAGEACANEHAEYDSTRDAHAGFSDRICENGGSAQNECPGWRSPSQVVGGCLQSMWDEGPPPQNPCQGQCFQDHGHFINMTGTRYRRVACGFFQTPGGQWWAVQNFSN